MKARLALLAAVAFLSLPVPGTAQDHAHHAGPEPRGAAEPPRSQRQLTVPLLTTAPLVDGLLSPGEWAAAAHIEGFVQRDPHEGAPSTERTEVFIARDAHTLFVAFVAWDRDLAQVRAVHTARDQLAAATDLVGIWLDPLRTGTRAFGFQFNPLGVQYDGIWSRQLDTSWDGILRSVGHLAGDHYVVEVALPIGTMVAGDAPDEWAVNFSRSIGRRSEVSWWAPVARAHGTAMLVDFGTLAGMASRQRGTRLEAIPSVLGESRVATAGAPAAASEDLGITLRLPLAFGARLDATVNPDFSFVDGDDAQIAANERWGLFYPEKRPFFLEGADQFGTPGANFIADPLRLVHTRTIARPRAGLRVTAAHGGTFVGATYTVQDRFDGSPDGSSAMLRLLRQRQSGSQAGATVTHRTHPSGRRNAVAAVDGQWRLGAYVTATAQLASSWTHDSVGGSTAGAPATAAYVDVARNDGRGFQELALRRVPASFVTDVGFVPRTDLLQAVAHLGHYWRPTRGPTQWINPMLQVVGSLDDAGAFADLEWLPHVEVQLPRETKGWLAYRTRRERYRERVHAMERVELRVRSQPRAWLDLGGGLRAGSRLRYDTDLTQADRSSVVRYTEWHASADLRAGRSASVAATAVHQSLGALPGIAAQSLLLLRARASWQFDNVNALRIVVQHDPDRRRWAQSLMLAHERDYGTQYHLGVQRGWPADAVASGGDGLRVFVRASHRLVLP